MSKDWRQAGNELKIEVYTWKLGNARRRERRL